MPTVGFMAVPFPVLLLIVPDVSGDLLCLRFEAETTPFAGRASMITAVQQQRGQTRRASVVESSDP